MFTKFLSPLNSSDICVAEEWSIGVVEGGRILKWFVFRELVIANYYPSILLSIRQPESPEDIRQGKEEIGDGQDILVRVYSECLTGDMFGLARCDCGNQLALAMQQIEVAGRGVLVYLDDGRDTVEASEELGLPVDSMEYGISAQILRDLGVRTMKLITNNPTKYVGLKGYCLTISGWVSLLTPIASENRRYLETKHAKMENIYGLGSSGHVNGTMCENGRVSNNQPTDTDIVRET
ncbi:unnamed protein product [Ilex paraguariensis]|uniref:3,4-dihydroxy-2-butanone-4-phosphate synthase n=1 Tax=Ilex paraguariensis TaxID=185542 RepID=A0ABC8TPF0_9AQUA